MPQSGWTVKTVFEFILKVWKIQTRWNTLKRKYKASDLATRKNAVFQMVPHTQSDFITIAKYGESIKQGTVKYVEMRNSLASWL